MARYYDPSQGDPMSPPPSGVRVMAQGGDVALGLMWQGRADGWGAQDYFQRRRASVLNEPRKASPDIAWQSLDDDVGGGARIGDAL